MDAQNAGENAISTYMSGGSSVADVRKYLKKIEIFLRTNFPECILIPTRNNFCTTQGEDKKNPAFLHKDRSNAHLWSRWENEGRASCQKGLLILLRSGMIVVDVDDDTAADALEDAFPEIRDTAVQKT